MTYTYNVGDFIHGNIFGFLLLMTRLGSASLFMPGIGESFVNSRSRVLFAVFLSFLLLPVLGPKLPAMPDEVGKMALLLFMEVTIGVFLGLIVRLMLMTLEIAGQFIALQLGIGNVVAFNPSMATQGSLTGAVMGILGVLLVFTTNLHHLFLTGLVKSYVLMPAGGLPEFKDMSDAMVNTVVHCFSLAVMMSAPFIILGTVLQVGLGLMARLQPQAQVFFVAIPLQMLLGFSIFAALIGSMMDMWLDHTADVYISLRLG